MEMKSTSINFNEEQPHSIEVKWNNKPVEEKDNRSWFMKHEETIFNGIEKMIEYITAGSAVSLGLYWLVQWLAK